MSEHQLPHIIPGQPRRSMYGERNTHDETVALTAAAFQAMAESLSVPLSAGHFMHEEGHVEREPIRVVAEVGRRIEP